MNTTLNTMLPAVKPEPIACRLSFHAAEAMKHSEPPTQSGFVTQ